MNLGEVVENNYPDFELTTSSPPADKTTKLYFGRIHSSWSREGKHSLSIFLFISWFMLFSFGLNSQMRVESLIKC